MSIISIVSKSQSNSILINRQISDVDKNQSHNFLQLLTLIDFNRQASEIQRKGLCCGDKA